MLSVSPLTQGLVLTIIGVAGVRLAWMYGRAGRPSLQIICRLLGWGLLLLASAAWMRAGGDDRGMAFGVLAFSIAGLVLVSWSGYRHWTNGNGRRGNGKPRNGNGREPVKDADGGQQSFLPRLLVFVITGPVSALASLSLTMNLHVLLEAVAWHPANRLAAELLFFPIAWALLSAVATYNASLKWRTSILLVLLLSSVIVNVFAILGEA